MHLISIIGAGPGNPDLLTIRALKRLEKADVVLYDALVSEEILDYAPTNAHRVYVGKIYGDKQDPKQRQEQIHKLMYFYALQDKRVVRIKSGDPMIFSRGAEEVRFCRDKGLNYELVPGITAALAASAEFEIPLTERSKSNMVLITTGHLQNGENQEPECLINFLESGSPIVMYMGLKKLKDTISAIKPKFRDTIDVHILSNISMKDQQRVSGNPENIVQLVEEKNPAMPALIIIGKNTYPLKEEKQAEKMQEFV